jgi:hypothetical protein
MPEESQAEATPEASGEDMIAGVEETPAVETPVESPAPDTPQEFDYAAYKDQVSALGDGYTPDNLVDKYQDSRRAMNKAQTDLAKVKGEYGRYDPFLNKMRDDDTFREGVINYIEQYGNDTGYAGDTTISQDFSKAVDPLRIEVNELKMKMANREIDEQFASMRASGMPIDKDDELEILNRLSLQGGTVDGHTWAVVGPKMVADASKSATQDTAAKIQENNAKYVDSTTLPATATEPVDIKDLPQKEIDTMMETDLAKMFGGGG